MTVSQQTDPQQQDKPQRGYAPVTSVGFGGSISAIREAIQIFSGDGQTNMMTFMNDIGAGNGFMAEVARHFNQFDAELGDLRDAILNGEISMGSAEAQQFMSAFPAYFEDFASLIEPHMDELSEAAEHYEETRIDIQIANARRDIEEMQLQEKVDELEIARLDRQAQADSDFQDELQKRMATSMTFAPAA